MADAKPGNAAPAKKAATGAYTPSGVSPNRRSHAAAIRSASGPCATRAFLEWFYHRFADVFLLLHPLVEGDRL
jgi:hypothetical protein